MVLLMDIRDAPASTASRRRGGSSPGGGPTQVLVLTTFDLDELVDGAFAAGAAGFLLKSVDATRLTDGVRAVARGEG
ncbi:hypothetical protein [Pseudonocardia sp. ICBG601]|uniref:hypothetical protein n=1 Tax=Pseudonocardia sp. ICBG601 TaxID=2846759 RepID=UPI001CF676A3|nr:hypothetical protein [Pseudonocardia sp. ICBG601]